MSPWKSIVAVQQKKSGMSRSELYRTTTRYMHRKGVEDWVWSRTPRVFPGFDTTTPVLLFLPRFFLRGVGTSEWTWVGLEDLEGFHSGMLTSLMTCGQEEGT